MLQRKKEMEMIFQWFWGGISQPHQRYNVEDCRSLTLAVIFCASWSAAKMVGGGPAIAHNGLT